MPRRILLWVLLPVAIVLALIAGELIVDRAGARYNPLLDPGPYAISEEARALHGGLFVADLHADSLLWSRDLRRRGRYGHVDLPRLAEGGVALQVFGLVTKVPKTLSFERNTDETDALGLMIAVARWPPRTWDDLFERARYQAEKLARLERSSDGRLLRILDRADLDRLVARRAAGEPVLGTLLGLEGAHALEGDFDNLGRLHEAGLRMLGLAHFFDNAVAGSAHGVDQGGLTDLGRRVVAEAGRLGIAIDLAHASRPALREVLAQAKGPVVVSHTGVRGTCPGPRNLSDDELRAVAATGGVVGIAFFRGATCGDDLDHILDAFEHAVAVAGVDHVAVGSDFDGAITAPFDASGLALVTQGLLERGFGRDAIAKILGGNALRVLRQTLSAES